MSEINTGTFFKVVSVNNEFLEKEDIYYVLFGEDANFKACCYFNGNRFETTHFNNVTHWLKQTST